MQIFVIPCTMDLRNKEQQMFIKDLPWYTDIEEHKRFMEHLAPIVLFTYNRLDHTRKTVKALQRNVFRV